MPIPITNTCLCTMGFAVRESIIGKESQPELIKDRNSVEQSPPVNQNLRTRTMIEVNLLQVHNY